MGLFKRPSNGLTKHHMFLVFVPEYLLIVVVVAAVVVVVVVIIGGRTVRLKSGGRTVL